ncbi:hypothetical protein A2Z33_06805 [Candidatus Gottesmanbacteria bacterium RBG_16_52_11]|uniref:Alanine--tRNA ligase n=1 Tax=Candidatus Gottesmanbacteria bacterium RBG_16_52_11 TaxID=1798374 RepID=A0A1F5YYJ7_9BACT|nr:MAG: hypothetical protein A2Z33_06805 [Candidatus Gottesmanbacteria bacterium RBG_16_52_11]
MKSSEIRSRFIDFYRQRQHAVIPSAPLVPQNDPSTLFTSSGMQPLIPYLLGEKHPQGRRLVSSQKSFRTQDIDEVGDNRHTTFFEMLGNWSLGDYFKKEQLPWIFEFLTRILGLPPERLYVSVFAGEGAVPKDDDSINIWKEIFRGVGIDAREGERIVAYPAAKNWWSRSGVPAGMPPGEPGGPDSEVFYDFGADLRLHERSVYKRQACHPNCDCGRFLEIANSVFMEYQKQADGTIRELPQKNVDFGGGLERLTAAENRMPDIFRTDMFLPVIEVLEKLSKREYGRKDEETRAMRVIADHIRGSVIMMADGVLPSNKQQGYVLRRLVRRSLLYGRTLGLTTDWKYVGLLVEPVAGFYSRAYPEVLRDAGRITLVLVEEAARFGKTLEKGLREIEKLPLITGETAFRLYETYGFPWEMTEEIARRKNQRPDREAFEQEFKKHQELSRTAAAGMFKGGLADHSRQVTKLHTATHLVHQALRQVLGDHVAQKGSNITADRLRFDFSHTGKISDSQLRLVESVVNEQIGRALPVAFRIMTYREAMEAGALAFFGERYPEKVKVYSIGSFSKEICGGPHAENTADLGKFTITREESAGGGIRRIYAALSRK